MKSVTRGFTNNVTRDNSTGNNIASGNMCGCNNTLVGAAAVGVAVCGTLGVLVTLVPALAAIKYALHNYKS